jgi:anti-anti-sigma factor
MAPTPAAGLVVSVSEEGTATVIAPRGEVDRSSLPVLQRTLDQIIDDHRGPVVVDLRSAALRDVAGMQAIVRAEESLGDRGRQLTIRSPSRPMTRLLAILGLAHLVEPPVADARADLVARLTGSMFQSPPHHSTGLGAEVDHIPLTAPGDK